MRRPLLIRASLNKSPTDSGYKYCLVVYAMVAKRTLWDMVRGLFRARSPRWHLVEEWGRLLELSEQEVCRGGAFCSKVEVEI